MITCQPFSAAREEDDDAKRRNDRNPMPKEEMIEIQGKVIEVLPSSLFRVELVTLDAEKKTGI